MIKGRANGSTEEIDFHVYNGQYFDPALERWIFHSTVSLMNAQSTGSVRLASTNPNDLPIIAHRHYADPDDLERMCDGLECARALYQADPLAELVELLPTAPGAGPIATSYAR